MTDKATAWVSQQKALAPDKPFFVYFAPGATHAPHHVPKEWADKYKGRFDQGWDKLREETIARQKMLGVIPADCQLTARHAEIPAWDEMPEALKPILRRQMEVYAGFLEYTDHHVGRLLDGLNKLGIPGDTLVYYIIGDNGASAEGTLNGAYNEMANFNGLAALEDPGIPDGAVRQARRTGVLQSLRRRLGARYEHPLSMDKAGRLALGRNPQWHNGALAQPHQRQRRDPLPVPPCHRRGAHNPRGGGAARAGHAAGASPILRLPGSRRGAR
jgi:arylsulfatase A-like enzyme